MRKIITITAVSLLILLANISGVLACPTAPETPISPFETCPIPITPITPTETCPIPITPITPTENCPIPQAPAIPEMC